MILLLFIYLRNDLLVIRYLFDESSCDAHCCSTAVSVHELVFVVL